jgi:hypothetical protein
VNLPIDFGNRIDVQHAVLAALVDDLSCTQALAVDAAVDDHVRDMDALGSVFSCHALCDHAQTGLGRREVSIARLAAQACRGAGAAGKPERIGSSAEPIFRLVLRHPNAAHAALDQALQEVVGDRPAVALLV